MFLIEKFYLEPVKFVRKYYENLECDHNHKTYKFRGWLCNNCNSGMGRFGDEIENLEQAIKYLRNTNEK